jgi:DNA-binding XRE family transcriptional regulator
MPTVTAPKRKPKPAKTWPERLKELRARLEITQAEAAERAGVAHRTWISWENAQGTPSRMALNLLKAAFPGEFDEI